jgi:Flp pilus assembly protein CpaB
VIGTYVEKDDSGKAPKVSSETLLTNIRVLAIGQNVQEKNGERVIVGSNATLEANPMQAERLVLAQRRGALSLTLRSMVDFADEPPVVVVADTKPALPSGPQFVTVSVVRNGTRHEYSVLDTRPTVAQ